MKQLVFYIAGPYRNKNLQVTEANVLEAQRMAIFIWKIGHVAICPHLNTHRFTFYDKGVTHEVIIRGDLSIVERCDAVYMLPGWGLSEGSKQEEAHAKEYGVTVLYSLHDLAQLLQVDFKELVKLYYADVQSLHKT